MRKYRWCRLIEQISKLNTKRKPDYEFFFSENKYTCTGMIFFEHTMPPTNVCLTVKTKRKGKKRLYRVSLPTCLIELVTNYILSFPFSLWIIILKIKRESENPHDEQILTAC